MPRYVDAVVAEIKCLATLHGQRVHTVYFGGGTPSLLPPSEIGRILQAIRLHFELATDAEITLEANPGTIDLAYFQALRANGVNRLSMGMQSAHDSELEMFGRLHRMDAVAQAMQDARKAGFENISLDLIYGNPHQTREMWRKTVQTAIALKPDHFSIYSLILEAGTEISRRIKYGELPNPDDDLVADMYDDVTLLMAEAGYDQYELSSWGRPSRHNLQYWRNLPYLGLGAGAHGYIDQKRTVNVMRPEIYINNLLENTTIFNKPLPATPATMTIETIDRQTDMAETIFMGLRLLNEGIQRTHFNARYGVSLHEYFADEITQLVQQGLLLNDEHSVRLTAKARLISNVVFRKFLQEP